MYDTSTSNPIRQTRTRTVSHVSAALAYAESLPKDADQRMVSIMQQIEKTWQIPSEEDIESLNGYFSEDIDLLVDAVQMDGEPGYARAKTIILNKYPRLVPYLTIEQETIRKYQPLTLLDLLQRPRPQWIIEDFIYEETVGLLFGPAGTKKSFLAFDWCAHIALGMDWQGHKVKQKGKFVYLVAEGADNFIARALAWCHYHNKRLEDLSENLLIVPHELPLSNAAEVAEYITTIAEYLQNVAPMGLVFDTLMRCSGGGNINSPDIMAALFDGANNIRRDLKAKHALIVHHEGKDSTKGSAGSFVLRANYDIVHHLTCDESTGLLTLSCKPEIGGKMKDKAPYPDTYLKSSTVSFDDEKDDASLVLEQGEKPKQEVRLSPSRKEILDALPKVASMRFSEWLKAVNLAREEYNQRAMPKQTFIDNVKWLVNHRMVEKIGMEDGTDNSTYHRINSAKEATDE